MLRIREVFDVELRVAAFYQAPTLAACAAAIDAAQAGPPGRRCAATGCVIVESSAGGTAAPTAYPPRSRGRTGTALAPHLVRLSDDWALWRTVCLRGAGLPFHLLATLGDADLARAADAAIAADAAATLAASDPQARVRADAAYAAEFTAAVRRLSAGLHEAAMPAGAAGSGRLAEPSRADDRHRRAGTPRATATQAQRPAPAARGARRELSAALLREERHHRLLRAGGLVAASTTATASASRTPAPGRSLAARVTYLEGWAVHGDHGRSRRRAAPLARAAADAVRGRRRHAAAPAAGAAGAADAGRGGGHAGVRRHP